jgi:hypothetical protein
MKKTALLLYLFLILVPVNMAAQTINAQDEKLIDDYLRDNLTSEKTVVSGVAIGKVFNGNFYIVDPGYKSPEGTAYVTEFFVNVSGGEMVLFEQLTNDKDLPVLLSLVKKGYLLKDEASAKLFEASLNELYPVKESDRQGIKHIKKNNQWVFLRGKFFDDQTAVIATVAANGTITKLQLLLAYK